MFDEPAKAEPAGRLKPPALFNDAPGNLRSRVFAIYGILFLVKAEAFIWAGVAFRRHRSGDLTALWVLDEGSEALRDLVRGCEAAKRDQLRARHRLNKFLLRSGQRPAAGVRDWTHLHLIWVSQIRFAQVVQESTRLDYLHEVEHMRERVARLEQAKALIQAIHVDQCSRHVDEKPAFRPRNEKALLGTDPPGARLSRKEYFALNRALGRLLIGEMSNA
ncbi:MAG: hypothetical protein WBG54_04065 [Acidobacteriaceae bacterium]